VALLFAPKSGRELRGDIADVSRKSIDYTTENAKRLQQRAGELVDTTSAKAQDLYAQTTARAQDLIATGKETVASKREQLTAAIEAGKDAYAEEKNRAGGAAKGAALPSGPTTPNTGNA
jgi:gas vesicle protein